MMKERFTQFFFSATTMLATALLSLTAVPANAATGTPHRIAAADTYADSVVLYGLYADVEHASEPQSTYWFHPSSAMTMTKVATGTLPQDLDDGSTLSYAIYGDGKYYAFYNKSDYDYTTWTSVNTNTLKVFDANTLEDTGAGGTISSDISFLVWGNGTYDPSSKKLYFYAWNADYDKVFYSLDPSTLELKALSSAMSRVPSFVAAGLGGKLYGLNSWDNYALYSVDITNGAITKIGDTGLNLANQDMSGAVDAQGNKLYVAATDTHYDNHFYSIDLATGATYKIADLPKTTEEVDGEQVATRAKLNYIYILPTEAKAPAAPTGISLNRASDDAKEGTLTFTAPTKTFDGTETLSGDLIAEVTIDGTTTTKTVAAGADYSQDVTLSNGQHLISVSISNAAGKSQERRFTVFAGKDLPGAADSVKFTLNENTRQATVTWKAPTKSSTGGTVDESTISYRVIRMPQDTVVSDNQKELTFTENLGNERRPYYYNIVSMQGNEAGDTAKSNTIRTGSYYVPPFKDTFDQLSDFEAYSVQDANGDGIIWHYDQTFNTHTAAISSTGDDYLITPMLKLNNKQAYRLYFKAGGSGQLRVYIGRNSTFTGNETLIGNYKLSSDFNEYSLHATLPYYAKSFNVDNDGDYYIAFRRTGSGDANICDIEVEPDAVNASPAAVGGLTLAAGKAGALNDTITFTAPTATCNGSALNSISKIEIYEDVFEKTPVKTFDNPAPGAKLSFVHDGLKQGMHGYTVRAFNADGRGAVASDSIYVGVDTPLSPKPFRAKMNDELHAVLTWDAVAAQGVHGGYVDTAKVTYNVYRFDEDSREYTSVVKGLTGLTTTDNNFELPENAGQKSVRYEVEAVNATGTGDRSQAYVTLGLPYEFPYEESFPEGEAVQEPWTVFNVSGNYYDDGSSWTVTGRTASVEAQDNDGGLLSFSNLSSDKLVAGIQSPRIEFENDAELSFYLYHGNDLKAGDMTLDVYASGDDADTVKVGSFDYNDGTKGWARHSVSLSAVNGASSVQVIFMGTAKKAGTLYLDKVGISKIYNNDLAVESAIIPVRVTSGDTATVSTTIRNTGKTDAGAFTVSLLRDGNAIGSKSFDGLAVNEAQSASFTLTPKLVDAGRTYKYQISIAYDTDDNADNNTSALTNLYVAGPGYPKVDSLSGSNSGKDVVLSWNDPTDQMIQPVTDSFEDYDEFIIDGIGNWKVYDADKYPTVYWSGAQGDNAHDPMAWWVWNSADAGFHHTESVKAHSGNQQLAAFSACGIDEYTYEAIPYPNKNWLISPAVVPGTDVSFWVSEANAAYGPETFQFLYSTTNDNYRSFKVLGSGKVVKPGWIEYAFTLPKDAKYFAILHNTKKNGQVMFLDDVTYTPADGTAITLEFKGYNIYRDGELIDSLVQEPTYTDAGEATSQHTYQVSTVWNVGESMASDVYTNDIASGIAAISNDGMSLKTANGAIILNGDIANAAVYTVGGAQVFRGSISGSKALTVAPGIYIVKAGNRSYKIIVK